MRLIDESRLVPTPRTRTLQRIVASCSIVFAIGTALHNFAIVDTTLVETMMRTAGTSDPARAAPGFATGLRLVGSIYLVGNVVGVLALWTRSAILWWTVLAVNATQALGFVLIPPAMWTAVSERYGFAGVLPSAITDGGAVLLALLLIVISVRFRQPWALRRAST